MTKLVFLLAIITIFILSLGCVMPLERPAQTGEECNSQDCFTTNFSGCTESFGNLVEEEIEIYYQIIGPKENNCQVYIELNKFRDMPEILTGLNAKCIINFDEMMILQNEMNIEKLNCEGPLYETMKQLKQFKEVE